MNVQLSKMKEALISERLYSSTNKSCREFEISFNGKKIPPNARVIGEKDSIYLKDIIHDNSIVLRYSESHCNTCINTMIENLNKFSNYIESKNIILLSTSVSPNYISQIRKVKNIKFSIYELPPDLENLFKDIDIPYYFVIEKCSMRVNSAFVPQKEYPELIDAYLKNVIKEYFNYIYSDFAPTRYSIPPTPS
jgi:hypothetical protein